MDPADFVVVGGGIAGASSAYELAAHGSVILLEQEATLGYHTTGRSAAMFTESYESGVVRRLTMASREFLEAPAVGFADQRLLRPLPLLFLGRPDQQEAIARVAQEIGRHGPPVHVVDRREVLDICPILRAEYVGLGVFEPDAREIDVHALHQGFVSSARRRGADIRTGTRVIGLERGDTGWTVESTAGAVSASFVVNAAGAWADVVGRLAGAPGIGLRPMRRTAFTFPSPRSVDPRGLPFVSDVDEDWYFKPEGAQFLGSLSEETPMKPHDVRHEERDVALAIDRISRAVTFEIRHVQNAWAGLRSFVADRGPVVGEDPDLPGFFWLAGQGGFGIMTSPAMARALTGLATRGRLPPDLEVAGLTEEQLGPARLR